MKKNALVIFTLALLASCRSQQTPHFDEDLWLRRVNAVDPSLLYEPHRDEAGSFFNPWMPRHLEQQNVGRFWGREKMAFEAFPAERYGHLNNTYDYLSDPDFDSISFADHASFFIKIDGATIIADPFFSSRALVINKKIKIPFDFSKVPQNPVVLISHNHYDHLDKKSIKQLSKKKSVFIVPLGLKDIIVKWGAREVHELDWWESVNIAGIKYTLLPAQHWSRRIGQKANSTLWGSFMIEASKTIYYSGDTGYFCGFKEFGRLYDIDYAILGVGAYEPRWFMHYQHMNVAEFFLAIDDLNAKISIPMHFGTISLSDEPLVYPLYETDLYLEKHPQYINRVTPLRVGGFIKIE
ncbi:MAG: MBL fold metallo-hydrolase [Treponema sp.]|nr:MBL fold metallo-hydrolase [Treponema sp.]